MSLGPRPVAGRIGSNLDNREDYANFSAAGSGVSMLAYLGTRQVDRQLALGDRKGLVTSLAGPGEFRARAIESLNLRSNSSTRDEGCVSGNRKTERSWTVITPVRESGGRKKFGPCTNDDRKARIA